MSTKDRPKLKDRKWVKWLVGIVIVVGFVSSFLYVVLTPTEEPDTPSKIQCEPPLKNYNSVCSCGPDMEISKDVGGVIICKPISQ